MTTETDTRQRNNELFPLVVSGDQSARDEMIEMNMPLVTFKVEAYLGCLPHLAYLRDDLMGEGNLSLVEAVNKIRDGGVDPLKVTGYLSLSIHRAIGHFIDSELYTSDRQARKQRRRGDDPTLLHKVPNSDFVLAELDEDTRKEDDLLELILDCCESDEERAIVDLRIKGYKDDEIANQLEMSKTTVFMLRREMYERCLATGEITSD